MSDRPLCLLPGTAAFFGILSFALIVVTSIMAKGAMGDSTISDPLTIDGNVTWSGGTVHVEADVRIASGGSLTIKNAILSFESEYPLSTGITVDPGGRFVVGGDGGACRFERGSGSEAYYLRAHINSEVTLEDLTVSGIGMSTGTVSPWGSGNSLRGQGVTVINCTFRDSYIGLCLDGSLLSTVVDCRFLNCSQGLWVRQSHDVHVKGCSFINCTKGLVYRNEDSGSDKTIDVLKCTFIGCSYGLSMNGHVQQVRECSFVSNRVGFRGKGARSIHLSDSEFGGGETGVDLNYVDDAQIVNVSIDSCQVGIEVSGASHATITHSSIHRCDVAILVEEDRWADGSSVRVSDSLLKECSSGLVGNAKYPWTNPVGSIDMVGNRFDDVGDAYVTDGVLSVLSSACVFEGDKVNFSFVNSNRVSIGNDSFDCGSICFTLSNVTQSVMNDAIFDSPSLSLNLTNVSAFLLNPIERPSVISLRAGRGTDVRGTILPDDILLSFLDEDSVYRWIKWVVLEVRSISEDGPIDGCAVELRNNVGDMLSKSMTGPEGRIDAGEVTLSLSSFQGYENLCPHSVKIRWNGTAQGETQDLASFAKYRHEWTIHLDDINPTISLTSPVDLSIITSRNVTVAGLARDGQGNISSVSMIVDDESAVNLGSDWDLLLSVTPGWHTIVLEARDAVGNIAAIRIWFKVSIGVPSLSIDTPSDGTITKEDHVTLSGEALNCSWLTFNSAWTLVRSNGTFSKMIALVEGMNPIDITYGNEDLSGTKVILIIKDSSPPEIEIGDIPRFVNRTNVTLRGTIADDNPPLQITVDNRDVPLKDDLSFIVEVELEEGLNTFNVRCVDMAGNIQNQAVQMTVDTLAHLELLTEIPHTTTDPVIIVGIAVEPNSSISVLVDNESVVEMLASGGDVFFEVPLNRSGPNDIMISAQDRLGNTAVIRFKVELIDRNDEGTSWILIAILVLITGVVVLLSWYLVRGYHKTE